MFHKENKSRHVFEKCRTASGEKEISTPSYLDYKAISHRFTGEPQWIAKTAVLGPSVMLTQLCHVAVGQDIRTIMETQLGLF